MCIYEELNFCTLWDPILQLYLILDFVQKTELLAQSNTDDDDDDDDDDDSDDDKWNYVNELPVSYSNSLIIELSC